MSEPVRGIVVAHGSLAQGLVDAATRIMSVPEGALIAISNNGLSTEALAAEVDRRVGTSRCVVFVDLPAGSCAFAARRLCLGHGERAVVTGVNLPMLLEFSMHRDEPPHQLAHRLAAKGRDAIAASNVEPSRNADRSVPGG
ncbi:MAG: PTS sugar transporter subunit IIA [Longimicrobiales bacterium]